MNILAFALAAFALAAQPPAPAPRTITDAEIIARYPPPGRMVDIGGGRRLHLHCMGPDGGPTVLIETGAISSAVYYRRAQEEVAKFARACVYDRAGLGWSDPVPFPLSIEGRADDLHRLIEKASFKGPLILAGHSMGGLIIRTDLKKHPGDAAAVVLIEASEEQSIVSARGRQSNLDGAKQLGDIAAGLDAGFDVPFFRMPGGPAEQEIAVRAAVFRTGQEEMLALSRYGDELQRLGGLGGLGSKPLVVMRRGRYDPGVPEQANLDWLAAQQRLAALSTRSVMLVSEKGRHTIHSDAPEDFARAVRTAMAMLR